MMNVFWRDIKDNLFYISAFLLPDIGDTESNSVIIPNESKPSLK